MSKVRKAVAVAASLALALSMVSASAVSAFAAGIAKLSTHDGYLVSEEVYGAVGDGYFLIDRTFERTESGKSVYRYCHDVVDKDGKVTIKTYYESKGQSAFQYEFDSPKNDVMRYTVGSGETEKSGLIGLDGKKITGAVYDSLQPADGFGTYYGASASGSGVTIDAYNGAGNKLWSYTDSSVTSDNVYLESYGAYLKMFPYDSDSSSGETYATRWYKLVSGGCEYVDAKYIERAQNDAKNSTMYVRVSENGTITLDNTVDVKTISGVKLEVPADASLSDVSAIYSGDIVAVLGEYEVGEPDEDGYRDYESTDYVFINFQTGKRIALPATHKFASGANVGLEYIGAANGCAIARCYATNESDKTESFAAAYDASGSQVKTWNNRVGISYDMPVLVEEGDDEDATPVTLYAGSKFSSQYRLTAKNGNYDTNCIEEGVCELKYVSTAGKNVTTYLDAEDLTEIKDYVRPNERERFTVNGVKVYEKPKTVGGNQVWCWVDKSGKEIKIGSYTIANSPLAEGAAGHRYIREIGDIYYVTDGKGKYGAVTDAGKVVVPVEFSEVYDRNLSTNSYIIVKRNGAWCTYDLTATGGGYGSSGVPNVSQTALAASWFKLSPTSYVYNGKAKKPTVTNSKYLVEGTDYTVSYASGRKKAGKYKVTIKGTGAYKGAVTKTFIIKPAKVTGVKAKAQKGYKLKVTWSNTAGKAAGVTGYTVSVYVGKKVVKKKTVKGASKKSATIALAAKYKNKKGKVSVAAYKTIDGKKVYGAAGTAGSKVKIVKKLKKK